MVRKIKCIALLLSAWALALPITASSFALRNMEKGDKVPDLELAGISGEGGKLSSFAGGKGLIVIYWATWSARSAPILGFAEKSLRRYEAQGMKIVAVNADHQEMKAEDTAAVKAKAAELGLSFPVLLDAGLKGYNELGIISLPTTLIMDKDLKLVDAYPGFPSAAQDEIPDRLDAFLGIVKEKREEKAQYLLDHAPKNHALMYYNLGKRLFLSARSPSGALKVVPDSAIERLDEAIKRDPDFFRPYLLKAIILQMANADGTRTAALKTLAQKDFQEPYERRVLSLGYLYMGMDNQAADLFRLLDAPTRGDGALLFGEAVAAARRKDGAGARKALEALGKLPDAREKLGADPALLFTDGGDLKPGADKEVRAILERLLEIENQTSGGLRSDAPVGSAPQAAPATPAAPAVPAPGPGTPAAGSPAPPLSPR
jgi:peroxiredoxin